jgi:hypothetical protein
MDPRGGLETAAKRKTLYPVGNGTPVVHPIAQSLY